MTFGRASAAGRSSPMLRRSRREGDATVACAAAAPLVALALAVAVDYASVSRFRAHVQVAADAASLAAAEAVARRPDEAGASDVDDLATHVAAAVFMSRAPPGAGTPSAAAKSRAAAVTATVAYEGVAPSNFGSALGYDAISVNASAISLARLADSRLPAER
jgi:uncharacterized membrane protein